VETETALPKSEFWYHGYRADGFEPLSEADRTGLTAELAKASGRAKTFLVALAITPLLAIGGAFAVYSDPKPGSGLLAAAALVTVAVSFLLHRDQRRLAAEATQDLAAGKRARFVLADLDDEPFEPSPDVLRAYAHSFRIIPGQTTDAHAIRLAPRELGTPGTRDETPARGLTDAERTELTAQKHPDARRALATPRVTGEEANGKWIERIEGTDLVWTINHLPAPWRRSSQT